MWAVKNNVKDRQGRIYSTKRSTEAGSVSVQKPLVPPPPQLLLCWSLRMPAMLMQPNHSTETMVLKEALRSLLLQTKGGHVNKF